MTRTTKSKSGFTLVELLVVIGIIALLISILLPSLSKARKSAYLVQCQSNLRQFGIGIQIYADTYKEAMPQKGPDGSTPAPGSSNFFGPGGGVAGINDSSLWFNAIPQATSGKSLYQMILDDQKGRLSLPVPPANSLFICPMAAQSGSINSKDIISPDGQFFLLGGSDSTGAYTGTTFKFDSSYVYNSKFTDTINVTGPTALRITQCRPAAEVVTMVEKMSNFGEYGDASVQKWNAQYPSVYAGKITPQGLNNNIGQPKSNWKRFTTRHKSGGNILFADGHVAWFAWTDAQIPANQMPFNANTSNANQPGKMIWSVLGPIN